MARFLTWKRAQSSVGDDWIRRMAWELRRFPALQRRVGGAGPVGGPRTVRAEQIALLRTRLPWARPTFMIHFAALRQLLRWSGNPVADHGPTWSLPSGAPTHRRWLSKEQLTRLYRRSEGAGRILVGLEGLNGLRRVEVLRLRPADVLFDEDCLLVRGKGSQGGKWRRIPMHPDVHRDLRHWVTTQRPEERVLPLARSSADLVLQRAVQRAGLGPGVRVSHHDLRRSFGRLAHEAGMDLVQLKNLLGHASVEMSVHYIGLDSERMREGLERFSRYLGGPGGRTPSGPAGG
ncbi:MAG TPA: site-specific integrase [Thermoplasmata archaeon]|nr:site-specific integrase [Thermoplasmata archaeon]